MASESFRLWEALDGAAYRPARSLLSLLSLLLPLLLSLLLLSLVSLESLLPSLLSRGGGLALDSLLGGRTVWVSQAVGVGVCCDLIDWSLADTDRTILLSFSAEDEDHQLSDYEREDEPLPNFLPMSRTLPPRLVSNPSGALQVGQYCDSNSLMYS